MFSVNISGSCGTGGVTWFNKTYRAGRRVRIQPRQPARPPFLSFYRLVLTQVARTLVCQDVLFAAAAPRDATGRPEEHNKSAFSGTSVVCAGKKKADVRLRQKASSSHRPSASSSSQLALASISPWWRQQAQTAAAAADAEAFGSSFTKPVAAGSSCQRPGCQLTLPQTSVSNSSTSQLWLQDVKIEAPETAPEVAVCHFRGENLVSCTRRGVSDLHHALQQQSSWDTHLHPHFLWRGGLTRHSQVKPFRGQSGQKQEV